MLRHFPWISTGLKSGLTFFLLQLISSLTIIATPLSSSAAANIESSNDHENWVIGFWTLQIWRDWSDVVKISVKFIESTILIEPLVNPTAS